MDDHFSVLGIRFGYDVLIGLIPGLGTFISSVLSLYLVWIAFDMKLPYRQWKGIVGLLFVDMFFGMIPIIGWIFDAWFKANLYSLRILQHYEKNKVTVLHAED